MKNLFWLTSIVFILSSCSDTSLDEVKKIMAEAEASASNIRAEQPISFEAYEPFSYRGSNKRSPFKKPVSVQEALRKLAAKSVVPDRERQKEYLEQFDIASLSYVGVISQKGSTWALIKDGEGKVHRVTVGEYLGKEYGQIKSITEDSIIVVEIVPNGIDSWLQRPFNLSLQGE